MNLAVPSAPTSTSTSALAPASAPASASAEAISPVGALLREWRQRRRLSQLELACDAEISTKHLSFVETGRARPSREMLLQLAERLQVPLRERNRLFAAAGYAPLYAERALDDPVLKAAREAIHLVLAGHEPYPALAVDRRWSMVHANAAVAPLLDGVDAALLAPPANVLRLSLHPRGLAPRIVNLREWRAHLLSRLQNDINASGDPGLMQLLDELRGYPGESGSAAPAAAHARDLRASPLPPGGAVVPLRLCVADSVLDFFSTTTVFGTPLDVTLSELAIESFFPANAHTAERLRARR
ncbi:MAG TPA: helix-turn-helix transcriptional regulator [Zeimonas sp.]